LKLDLIVYLNFAAIAAGLVSGFVVFAIVVLFDGLPFDYADSNAPMLSMVLYLFVFSGIAGLVGGYVTAWIAEERVYLHGSFLLLPYAGLLVIAPAANGQFEALSLAGLVWHAATIMAGCALCAWHIGRVEDIAPPALEETEPQPFTHDPRD
jgi:putative membrane protein (TIGR04086 family)